VISLASLFSPVPVRVIPILLAATALPAQWLGYVEPGTPMKNGKPDMTAAAPRQAGKPDLSGVWAHEITSAAEAKRIFGAAFAEELAASPIGMEAGTVHKYAMNIMVELKPGTSALTPAGEAFMKKRGAERDVTNVCHGEYGWPVAGLLAEPFKLVQTPKLTLVMYEVDNLRRQIFTDGRQLPKEFDFPAYLGYSTGRWEGETFVVESAGFNDRTPLDAMGHPRSEKMHVTERYTRRDFGHMDIEYTFNDPVLYTKPFTVKIPHTLVADNDIFEMFCHQNEKDKSHMVK
jgi:hypothetical protein